MEVKYCKYCGEPFIPFNKKQFMCGDNECLKAYKREKWAEKHPRIEGAEGRRKYDIPERICIICGKVYKPRSCAQKTCGSPECRKENENRRVRDCYYRNKEKERRERAEQDERKKAFDKLVKEEGWRYGEIQAQKTLAMVEPIKLTLDEKGENDDNKHTADTGSDDSADRLCRRMFQAWVPRGDE